MIYAAGDTAVLLSGPMTGEECEVLWGPGWISTAIGQLYGYRVRIPSMVKHRRPPMGLSGKGYFCDIEELGPLPPANTVTAFDPLLWAPEGQEKKP